MPNLFIWLQTPINPYTSSWFGTGIPKGPVTNFPNHPLFFTASLPMESLRYLGAITVPPKTFQISHARTLEPVDTAPSVPTETFEISPTGPQSDESAPEGGLRANTVVLGSFLGFTTTFGLINSSGAIQTYISTHQLEHVNTSSVAWIFSIYMCIAFFGGIVTGPIFDRKGSRMLLAAGTLLSFAGCMALSFCTQVYQFILALSVCVGIGNALCIPPLIGVPSHWFLTRRGTAISVSTLGGSVGGLLLPLMLRSLYTRVGYGWAIRTLAFIILGCLLCSTFFVKERFYAQLANEAEVIDSKVSRRRRAMSKTSSFFDFQAFKEPSYAFLVAGCLFTEIPLLCIATYYATYAIAQGMSESDSYILLTVFNASGILGRLVPGALSDIWGHYNVMVLMLLGFDLCMLVLWLPFGVHTAVLYVFAVLCGFFSSSIFSLTPICLGDITTVDKFGQRYGLMYSVVSIGNLVGIPISAAIIGNGSQDRYNLFTMFCGLMGVVGTCCWYVSRWYIVGFKLNVKV